MVLTYEARLAHCTHPLAARLLRIMLKKQSNLCVSADVPTAQALLALADGLGPHICLFKTHIDCIDDFTPELTVALRALAKRHDFVIFEDRKFADIGATVKSQFGGGVHRIADWADLVNAHPLPGPGIVAGLKALAKAEQGLLLIAQMSAEGNLMDQSYVTKTLQMAQDHADHVMGFICTHAISDDARFLHMTPGVRDDAKGDALGQQYVTPHEAIVVRGTDIIIVGRGITHSDDPVASAQRYQHEGWEAAKQRSKR